MFVFSLFIPFNKHKIQLRSQECVYLEISPQQKGFRCLNKDGRSYISKDVIFNVQHFPFPKFFSTKIVPNNSKFTIYVSCLISTPLGPVAISFVPITRVTSSSQTAYNGTQPVHHHVPNSTNQFPLTDKDVIQMPSHKDHNLEG